MEPIEYQGSIEQFLCEKATVNHVPINAILELTPLCNMNCDMCFVRLSAGEMKQKGRLRSAEEWIGLGREMKEAGTLFVLFTGGEPLLHPDFRSIYTALKKMGMILTVNTNGTLIDEEWADFFAQYLPRRINITLYGANESTYQRLCHYPDGYQKARKAIKLLLERHIDVKINGTITPKNIEDLDGMFSIAGKYDTAWKFDTYLFPACRERSAGFNNRSRLSPQEAAKARVKIMQEKEQERFAQTASDFVKMGNAPAGNEIPLPMQCHAGKSSFFINWQGMIRPCVFMSYPEFDVKEMGFQEGWNNIVEAVSAIRLNAKCSTCTMRNVCQTCAACAVSETDSFSEIPEYMCRYTKETIRLLKEKANQKENN